MEQQRQEPPSESLPPVPSMSPVTESGPETPGRRKHSGPGIVSFILSLLMVVLFIGIIVAFAAKASDAIDELGQVDIERLQNETSFVFYGMGMLGAVVGNIVGLVLGIIGLAQKNRNKVFAVLGTVFNGGVVLLLLLMVFIGFLGASAV